MNALRDIRIDESALDLRGDLFCLFSVGVGEPLWARADDAVSTSTVLRWAQGRGLPLQVSDKGLLSDLIARCPAPTRTVLPPHVWHSSEAGLHYTTDRSVLGPRAEKFLVLESRKRIGRSVDCPSWDEGVTRIRTLEDGTRYSDLAITILIASIGTLLTSLMNRNAFSIHVAGQSTERNAIIANAIGSMYGRRNGVIRTVRSETKFTDLLAEREGAVCIVDDPGKLTPNKRRAAAATLNVLSWAVASEAGQAWEDADTRKVGALLVTVGKHNLDELFEVAGFASDEPDLHARVIQLHADQSPTGDRVDAFTAALEDFGNRDHSAQLHRIIEGVVTIWSDRRRCEQAELQFIDDERFFAGKFRGVPLSRVEDRKLAHFCFLYAVGCMLWRNDLLSPSFNPLPLSRALVSVFQHNRARRPTLASEASEKVICRYIADHKQSFKVIGAVLPRMTYEEFEAWPGFVRTHKDGYTEYCLTPRRIMHLIPRAEERRAMGDRLFERQLIDAEPTNSGKRYDLKRAMRANKRSGDRMWNFKAGIDAL